MSSRKITLTILAIFAFGSAVSRGAEVRYTVTDLGGFATQDINKSTQIVGFQAGRPSLWQNGTVSPLAHFGDGSYWVWGMNDACDAVGHKEGAGIDTVGLLYSGGGITELSTGGEDGSYAFDINNEGQVVGESLLGPGEICPFLWEDGVKTYLAMFPGGRGGVAYGLNDLGEVVGSAESSSGGRHGFVYRDGVMSDLGTLPGAIGSNAWAINAGGQIVGGSEYEVGNGGMSHAFMYTDGVMVDLGALGGTGALAFDINDYGQVVGWASTGSRQTHAFIWENGVMADLNDLIPAGSGWALGGARAINDNGRIVGLGDLAGEEHGFLLTPTEAPEPATLSLLVLGLSFLRRRPLPLAAPRAS